MEYLTIFLISMTGSLHCIGMCGGFVTIKSLSPGTVAAPRALTLPWHVIYNFGRLFTYVFLGALVGTLGFKLREAAPFAHAQQVLAVASGLLMVAIGMQTLGVLRFLSNPGPNSFWSPLYRIMSHFQSSRDVASALFLGVFTGFLPCSLVYAFSAMAASTGSALGGMRVMLAFGLGTFPAMFFMGTSGLLLRPALRHRLVQVSATLIVLLGIITVLRAVLGVHHGMDMMHDSMPMTFLTTTASG